jgi:hypothetical protein
LRRGLASMQGIVRIHTLSYPIQSKNRHGVRIPNGWDRVICALARSIFYSSKYGAVATSGLSAMLAGSLRQSVQCHWHYLKKKFSLETIREAYFERSRCH